MTCLTEQFNYVLTITTGSPDTKLVTPRQIRTAVDIMEAIKDQNLTLDETGEYIDWLNKGANMNTALELAQKVADKEKIYIFPNKEHRL